MDDPKQILQELVLNWKLRLVVSALFSIMGLSFLGAVLAGGFAGLDLQDQTIVGIAVFIVMMPIYLIIADLPKIDELSIAEMLNTRVPDFEGKAHLVLKPEAELNKDDLKYRDQVRQVYTNKRLYAYLPNRPMKQAAILLLLCLILSAAGYFLL